jgi:hypothetical protein
MKIKVGFFDKKLITRYLCVLTVISLFCSFAFIAIKLPDETDTRFTIGVIILSFLFATYLIMWLRANRQLETSLSVNNSNITVKLGDIFEEEGLKAIAFNEYFDTQVDEKIIASNTLNGIFLNEKINDIQALDNQIENDDILAQKILKVDGFRHYGKKKKYSLGTVFLNGDYILTAFTKFDSDNRAYLNMTDYINFLLNFWNEIDIIYAGRSVSIPLLGSGITRFKEYNTISEQELLELLIWSFKVSRIKFVYPSKVSIIIHPSKKDKINFYKLKDI